MHHGQQPVFSARRSPAGPRRCAPPARPLPGRYRPGDNGSASPSRPRSRTGRARGRACRRTRKSMAEARGPTAAARAPPTPASATDRSRPRGAAPRGLDRQAHRCRSRRRAIARRSCSAAATTAACRASRRGRRGRWRGCGRPEHPRSAAPRHRPRCGRNRSRARHAVRGRLRSDISRTPADRRFRGPSSTCRATARRAGPELGGEAHVFVGDGLRVPASPPSRTASISSGGSCGSTSRSGKCATRFRPICSL